MLNQIKLFKSALVESFTDTVQICYNFFIILIPIIIILKILNSYNLLHYVALPLQPIMELTGLPPDIGLAWATGIMINIYSAIAVFVSLAPNFPDLTAAQATTFSILLIIAHGLPAEGRITQQCGVSLVGQSIIRLVSAVIGGIIVYQGCKYFNYLQHPAEILFRPETKDPSLLSWALAELRNMGGMFVMVYLIMLLQRFMRFFKISDLLGFLLRPLLKLLGLGPTAATTIVIGSVTGILYGGGVIIKEAQTGKMNHHDILITVTLMSLCHAVIEDTLLMSLIGGDMLILFFLRLALALVVAMGLNWGYGYWKTSKT